MLQKSFIFLDIQPNLQLLGKNWIVEKKTESGSSQSSAWLSLRLQIRGWYYHMVHLA